MQQSLDKNTCNFASNTHMYGVAEIPLRPLCDYHTPNLDPPFVAGFFLSAFRSASTRPGREPGCHLAKGNTQ